MKKSIVMIAAGLLLAGCTASKPSPERHAIAFTENHSSAGGGTRFNASSTYRNIIPVFEETYEKGKMDRIVGHDLHYAIKHAAMINEEARHRLSQRYDRSGESEQVQSDSQDANLFGKELSAAYLDGYNGVD